MYLIFMFQITIYFQFTYNIIQYQSQYRFI
ncbi:hypothetical protein F383_09201 [Gossypium arboreum]|uniref:Uncharacterized protein n=1 Tax=Gossypium arboreum TaxID=29729 RepID=A0A0B0P9I7_GOSAR|nr:hypothetical protein F383_09201 [Gossypium arboreum]